MFNIPGDNYKDWRFNKFIEYHRHTDDNQLPFLRLFSMNMTTNEKYWLCFLYSTSYCVPTTMVLFELMFRKYPELMRANAKERMLEVMTHFWEYYKPHLIFQSDRMYVKNMNWFPSMITDFYTMTNGDPDSYFGQFFKTTPQETYDALYKEVGTWKYYGRLSIFLMLEAMYQILGIDIDSDWFNWSEGATTTSGMFHLLYQDDEAVQFDKDHKISKDTKSMFDQYLKGIKDYIRSMDTDTPCTIFEVESSLCMFRKLFKQSRYGGFYLDRTQDEIEHYEAKMPEFQYLWNMIWLYRKNNIHPDTLGELQGRHGIQSQKLSDWVTKGEHGFENIG